MILSYVKIKKFLNSCWNFVKAYWQFFVGALIPMAIMILFRKDGSSKVLREGIKRKDELLNANKEVTSNQLEKNEKATERYFETRKAIEEKFQKENKVLTESEDRIIKEILEEAGEDPEILTQKLKERFGL